MARDYRIEADVSGKEIRRISAEDEADARKTMEHLYPGKDVKVTKVTRTEPEGEAQ